MTLENGKNNYMLYGMAALFVVLFLVGTFFDHDIAKAVYIPGNPFALTLSIAEMYIFFGSFVFFDGVLCSQLMNSDGSRKKKTVCCIICVYLALSTSTIGSAGIIHEECLGMIFPEAVFPLWSHLPFGAAVFSPLFLIGYRLNGKRYDKNTVKRIIMLLVFITAVAVLPSVIKSFSARPRYRFTLQGYEEIVFCPWYSPLKNSETYKLKYGLTDNSMKSFPSGHSVDAVVNVCIFPALSWVVPKFKGKEKHLYITAFVLALLVMLSRMMLGAHYLSDVSFGGLTGAIVCIIYTKILNKRTEK